MVQKSVKVTGALTEHRAGGGLKGLALQAPPIQEVAVGRAGVTREAAGSVEGAQEQKHGALVVAHKVRLPCGRETPGVPM